MGYEPCKGASRMYYCFRSRSIKLVLAPREWRVQSRVVLLGRRRPVGEYLEPPPTTRPDIDGNWAMGVCLAGSNSGQRLRERQAD